MDVSFASYGLGFIAGLLSTLSPCVLPIIPILLGAALNAHPKAPVALAGGLALSYAVIGTSLAWLGGSLGLDASRFRSVGAGLLFVMGWVLLSQSLQNKFAVATAGFSNSGHSLMAGIHLDGLSGQFIIGLVLGAVWSPCVGPTLGVAIVLASQGQSLVQAAMLMAIFGLGAALPVVVLGQLSRAGMQAWRGRLLGIGQTGKKMMGWIMMAIAIMIWTGLDKQLEALLVERSPQWLTELTTRF